MLYSHLPCVILSNIENPTEVIIQGASFLNYLNDFIIEFIPLSSLVDVDIVMTAGGLASLMDEHCVELVMLLHRRICCPFAELHLLGVAASIHHLLVRLSKGVKLESLQLQHEDRRQERYLQPYHNSSITLGRILKPKQFRAIRVISLQGLLPHIIIERGCKIVGDG